MPKIKDVFLNDPSYGLATYISEWINVSAANYTVFSVYSSGNLDVEIEYAFDDQFQIVETFTTSLLAGDTLKITKQVLTPFQRFKVINLIPPQDLKLQGWFFTDELGLENLENLGTGVELYNDDLIGVRSLVSADSSVTITQSPTELDFSAAPVLSGVSLSSAGGTYSLINDGTGPTLANKGLTAGTDISIVDSGIDLTINSTAHPVTTLTSAGGTYSLVNDGVGPTLANKGITAGANISIIDSGLDLQITGSTPPTVTLGSAGGTFNLVSDGIGPALLNKGLTAGSGISIVNGGTDLTLSTVQTNEINLGLVDGSVSTNSATYTAVASIVYRGTNNINTIQSVKSVVESTVASGVGNIRLFDATNTLVIATSANFSFGAGVKSILDLGAISNVPANEALLEVQVRKVSGGGNIIYNSAILLG